MVRADELYAEVSQDPSGKTPSQGLFIGCFIDTSTGIISFTCVECQLFVYTALILGVHMQGITSLLQIFYFIPHISGFFFFGIY